MSLYHGAKETGLLSFCRQMREEKVKKKSEQTVEEAELCMSVTERILKMQNKIVERQLSTGPRARPGAATPVSAKSQ